MRSDEKVHLISEDEMFKTHRLEKISEPKLTLKGEVLKTALDPEDNRWFFMHIKEGEGQYCIKVVHVNSIYEVDLPQVDENTHLSVLNSNAENTQFVIQQGSMITLYEIILAEDEKSVIITELYSFEDLVEIKGRIHSAMSNDIMKYLFLVDSTNFYLLNCTATTKEERLKIFKDQNCVGLQFIDGNFCYTLTRTAYYADGTRRKRGLHLYDIKNLLHKGTDRSYQLMRC